MNNHVLVYRAFDFRDRFPMPFTTFTQALEVLQSENAYMPEYGSISCYLKGGQEIPVPNSFFVEHKLRFENKEEAKAWLIKRNCQIKNSPKESIMQSFGACIADPTKSFDEQVEQALLSTDERIISADKNKEVAQAVSQYLSQKINILIENSRGSDEAL
ncbi:MAG: hypothetical protein OCD00_03685 [Colwellia sp.]